MSRRPGVGDARRSGFRGIGGGSSVVLGLLSGGTFTRSTEGSYLTAAPTDGAAAFLAWAGVNARRIEDRGDGLGSMLLMEGARTNQIQQSRDITSAAKWTAAGSLAVVTADASTSPDGTASADRVNCTGVLGFSRGQGLAGLMANPHVISGYARPFSGNPDWRPNYGGPPWTGALGAAAAWARKDVKIASTGATLYAEDNSAGTSGNPDVLVDLWQAENGAFPSSPIRTTTVAVTRGADVLSYAVGQYPESFLTRGFRIKFAPDCSSAEHALSTHMGLVGTGATQYVLLNANQTMQLWGTAMAISSQVLTWSRGQLLTITAEPSAGRLTVSGATSGNGVTTGSASAWAAATIFVGNYISGSGLPAFGRFGTTIEAL